MTVALIIGALVAVAAVVTRRVVVRRRVWLSAFIEQGRRESNHDVEFRHDQRIRAIQQRLSRHIGPRAFSAASRRRIVRHLGLDR